MASIKRKTDFSSFTYKFGQNLARIRLEQGLTHVDMELYGISRSYYGKVELGVYSISLSKINLIAKAFGVPVSSLFFDAEGNSI
ncbi:helix-turn-helix domain-containing protein [Anaerorhabdus sp.]|uniref:helix-turn-helix domain-containing protein n=1 Tax=Anaerorhabdus sp. TaxID=1872524 RepID=UPI002FCA87E9